MKIFSTIDAKDYTVEEFYVSAPIAWQLVSSSAGIQIVSPDQLDGAVTIQRAANDRVDFYQSDFPKINVDSGVYEYILHRSITHLFYNNANFYSGSILSTSSMAGVFDTSYVISIGQNFYGDRVKPLSFTFSTDKPNEIINDDGFGNLYTSHSSGTYYIGNIFYEHGIAVVLRNPIGAPTSSINGNGVALVANSDIYINYSSDIRLHRHEANIKLLPTDYNFSPFNPSITSLYETTGSITASFNEQNIRPSSGSTGWALYNLMGAGVIKPYVTTIGLYNDQYELLAVAKLSEPIQRTFDVNQIFIVRFDT